MSEPVGNILPIYFVADESSSMSGSVGELNKGLESLLDALHGETMAAAKVRFCVIGFASSAVCHLEPVDLRERENMPELSARGTTSYASAFNALYDRIPSDIARWKGENYLVHRPAVFFLTDGAPNSGDGWQQAHDKLTAADFRYRPNILAFGIGDAVAEVIRQVATSPKFAFVVASGVDTGHAIVEFIKTLTQSVIASGQAVASGQEALQVEKPDSFVSLDVDTV